MIDKEKLKLLKENCKIKYSIIELYQNLGNSKDERDLKRYLLNIIDFNYKEDYDFNKLKEKFKMNKEEK